MGSIASKVRRTAAERKSAWTGQQGHHKHHSETFSPTQSIEETETKPVFLSASDIASKPSESFPDTSKGRVSWSTLLSSGLTPSNRLTAGIATCPANGGYLGHHRHEQAEVYFILEGKGLMKVGETEQRVSKGGVVFVPGKAEHGIKNVSAEEDLVWFYCFPTDRFEDVVYRFSDDK